MATLFGGMRETYPLLILVGPWKFARTSPPFQKVSAVKCFVWVRRYCDSDDLSLITAFNEWLIDQIGCAGVCRVKASHQDAAGLYEMAFATQCFRTSLSHVSNQNQCPSTFVPNWNLGSFASLSFHRSVCCFMPKAGKTFRLHLLYDRSGPVFCLFQFREETPD